MNMDLSIILCPSSRKLTNAHYKFPLNSCTFNRIIIITNLFWNKNTGERNLIYQLIFDLHAMSAKTQSRSTRLSLNLPFTPYYREHTPTYTLLQLLVCTATIVLYPITFVFKFYDICIILILTWFTTTFIHVIATTRYFTFLSCIIIFII
jgi:hypothetical protein